VLGLLFFVVHVSSSHWVILGVRRTYSLTPTKWSIKQYSAVASFAIGHYRIVRELAYLPRSPYSVAVLATLLFLATIICPALRAIDG
jgi:hypothetical protein